MAESERRRLITSTPHLTAEEVVQRSFTTSFRGYSEAEVRAFLKRVSEELVGSRDRETELLGAIDSLEEQLRSPRPLNEPEMLDALGAETTRLLRSAREAADEIRTKAEERATRVLDDARAEAERISTETDEVSRTRTEEAETLSAALVAEAEERAADVRSATESYEAEERLRADREVEEIIESARHQGREMLDEAKATRERVLADLFRRRSLLQAQIDELRAGRDNLLDAYRVVKRTFLEATSALAQVEARAAADRVPHDKEGGGTEQPAELLELADTVDAASEAVVAEGAEAAADQGEPTDPGLADVESLFARIRAAHTEPEPALEPDSAPAVEAVTAVEVPEASAGDGPDAIEAHVAEQDVAEQDVAEQGVGEQGVAEQGDAAASDTPPLDALASWRAQRAEVLDPLLVRVGKRAKRAAQDDQNALLDAVRRHKGRPTSAHVLPPEPDLLTAWVVVLREALDEAYGAGRVMVGGEPASFDDELAREGASTIVMPVRDRIATAIDTGEDADPGGLVERVGARFREWRSQSLEGALVDVLAMAWSRGVYDASPDGAVLRWIPTVEGRCADCDDNGLEPTVKGSAFPTGQLHPPAHPGCRCLLAPSDLAEGLAASA